MMLSQNKSSSLSRIALVVCYLVMCYTAFVYHPKWEDANTEATISWDVSGYYMYLPAAFIYKDLKKCAFGDSINNIYHSNPTFGEAFEHKESGNYVMKYSMGQAVVMSPFFTVGHIWASNSDSYPADGFSFPYQISIGIGMFLVALLGLFFLRKILLLYFKDSTVAILLLMYVVGTNYLNYSSVDQAMTHNSLFTIYTILIWTTIKFYQYKKIKQAIGIGMLCGLAALIRPPEIVSAIIPLFWGVSSLALLKERFQFLKVNINLLMVTAFVGAMFIIMQPVYWHYVTGDWIVYSYQDQGFNWLKPHIYDYSLSYRCGWLRYCPTMYFGIIGLLLYRKNNPSMWLVIAYCLLTFYITTAWDEWHYGGTAGRAMVQHYVVLAFPIAALIERINQKSITKFIFYPIAILFAYINIWGIRAGDGNIDMGGTHAYYWEVIGRWSVEDYTKKLLDNPHLYKDTPENTVTLYENSLSTDSSDYFVLNEEIQDSEGNYFIRPSKDYKWLRASATFTSVRREWDVWKQCQFRLKYFSDSALVQENSIRVHRLIPNNHQTKEITLDSKPPKDWEYAKIEFANSGSNTEMKIKDLKVIGFDD